MDGLDLRWPGYLGRNYHESQGILCVGAVHVEVPLAELESNPEGFRSDQTQVEAVRTWLTEGRSSGTDEIFLERMRTAYEGVGGLPRWQRWRRHFRSLLCDHLGVDETKVAWPNLAKCKCAIHLGSTQRAPQANLVRLCQQEFPVRDLVEAIRPVAVLVSVLNAKANGPIVSNWRSASCDPLVFTWQGRQGMTATILTQMLETFGIEHRTQPLRFEPEWPLAEHRRAPLARRSSSLVRVVGQT